MPEKLGTNGDAAGDGVALLMPARIEISFDQSRAKAAEGLGSEEVADLDEALGVELLSPSRGHGGGESAPAHPGEVMGELQPGDVQAAAVQAGRAQDGIVGEALGAGRGCQPK